MPGWFRHLPPRITGQDRQRPGTRFTGQRTAEPEPVRHQEPLQTFGPALTGFTDRRKHNLRQLPPVAVHLSLFQFIQQAVQFAPVSVFLTHLRLADAVPLQLLRLVAREPCARQQVAQRGLRVILIAGSRERGLGTYSPGSPRGRGLKMDGRKGFNQDCTDAGAARCEADHRYARGYTPDETHGAGTSVFAGHSAG